MQFTTKVVFSAFLIGVSASFDLFGSLDDAREALMSFYSPVGPSRPRPVPTSRRNPKLLTSKPRPAWSFSLSLLKVSRHHYKPDGYRLSKGAPVPSFSVPVARPPSNKFVEAMDDIEKALADAQQIVGRVTHDMRRLRRLQNLIKTAVQKRSYRFARKAIGEAMFTISKMKESKGRKRGKRDTVVSSKDFLRNVKQKIGRDAFNDLLAMQGQVTLMFAIDKTGSMSHEIAAAKRIAESIVNQNRPEPVDYILSPFSDPESACGPVTYYEEGQKNSFVQTLKNLKANGGGDCPELTFKGMIDAINEGPYDDSPMYVFTDAGPKDGGGDSKTNLLQLAENSGHVINFFVFEGHCSRTDDLTSFYEVARATTGQVFRLKHHSELQKLTGLTGKSLGGTSVISNVISNRSSRKKRSTLRKIKIYSIPVDDSVDTLVISVTADKSRSSANSWTVSLITPSGKVASDNPQNMDKVTVYEISKPSVGVWNLRITSDNFVNFDYYAKTTSNSNIDFEYYFVEKSRKGSFIPITNPIEGQQARAILTLGGVNKIEKSSLQAELMTLDGGLLRTGKPVFLKSKDKAGIRYSFTFTPPGQIFKIKLKGRTKKGNSFERISHNAIKSETLVIKVLYAKNDFTIPRRGSSYVLFIVENHGNSEAVDIRAFGSLGSVKRISKTSVVIRKGRKTSFSVTFSSDPKAEKGVTTTVVAFVKGKSSGSKSTLSVPLLVV